jgi:hypothetical protein
MNAQTKPQPETRFFSRVLGPFLVIVDITAIVRASDMRAVVTEFEASSVWSWVAGAFILLFGLVVVAAHPHWRGAAAIIVSLLGWLIVLRGLLVFAFPKAFASAANGMIGAQGWWVTICVLLALVGLYLTYVGWAPASKRTAPQAPNATGDLRRAA